MQENKKYVIADVRFPNEIKAIQRMGGKVIRIKRGDDPSWYYQALDFNIKATQMKPETDAHYSEWAWIGAPIDVVVVNSAIDDIPKKVDKVMKSLYNNVDSYEVDNENIR